MYNHQENSLSIQTNPKYRIVSAVLAFFVWGGWAFYANKEYGFSTTTISGLTQGIASAAITLIMIRIVTWIYRIVENRYLRLVFPALATVTITGSCMVFAHYLVGTPKIITTVAPGLMCGFLFCLLTTYKLMRIQYKAASLK